MDVAAAPAPTDLPPPPGTAGPSCPSDRVLGGVAGLLAARLGLDPLWVRLGFVLLALVGGLGLVVYLGLWLTLIVGARPGRTLARYAGGAVVLVGVPLLVNAGSLDLITGPVAVVALFVGLAIALWQPRTAAGLSTVVVPADAAPAPLASAATPPPPPSILGRTTLGAAVVVAAGGALVDHLNGGRLYPEQWLGVAAGVCGIGLLVGAFAGRALWLIIPAAAFAGTGFVAGEAARIDLEPDALFGDEGVHVGSDTPGGSHRSEHVVIGTVNVSVDDAPSAPVTVDARAAIGAVRISAATDVSVEVQASVDNGEVEVGDVERPNGTFTLGPEGTPDVVVLARVGRGEITVEPYRRIVRPEPPDPPVLGSGRIVAEGVVLSRSGQLVLAGGEAVIELDGTVLTGSTEQRDSITVVPTSLGDFQLLPGDLLVTPFGVVLELPTLTPGG